VSGTSTPALAAGSSRPPATAFDVALLDLDGVVYVGPDAVPGVPDALTDARTMGMRLGFVTNNAARTPEEVARHLSELGVPAESSDVITSAMAAATVVAEQFGAGARVLPVGGPGVAAALRAAGLTVVEWAEDEPQAVVQGYGREVGWPQLAEAVVAVRNGARHVATNADSTIPSPRGPLPGNGAMVAVVRNVTGQEPLVTGKPDPAMHAECVRRTGAQRPLVVGDRLDTDIEGAVAAGTPSLLVLTGVTSPSELLGAPARARPTYVAADLRGLLAAHPEVTVDGDEARCGDWVAVIRDGFIEVRAQVAPDGAGPSGCGAARGDAGIDGSLGSHLDGLRAAAAACWAASDRRLTVREARFDGAAARQQTGSTDTASPQTTIPVQSAR